MQRKDCAGCEDNFYNGNNNLGVTECWRFRGKGNRIKKRFRINYNTPTNIREAYQEVICPTCYRQKGYCYFDRIPLYAKTIEQRKMETREANNDVIQNLR
jgi:hypothetical protein